MWGRALAAVGVGSLVGIGKELYDASCGGTPDAGDLVYDALGVGAGVGFALAVEAVARRGVTEDGG